MNFLLFVFVLTVGLLLLLLLWAARYPSRRAAPRYNPASLEDTGRQHVTHLPQMRQALSPADFKYLSSLGLKKMAGRLRTERRHVALGYLPTIHEDFSRLLRLARVIAVLSPQVHTLQEWERFSLTVQFYWRYQMIRVGLLLGAMPLPQLSGLSRMVSELAVRIETAMKELGERAALAAELASSLDNAGLS